MAGVEVSAPVKVGFVKAGVDLSGVANQYKFVEMTGADTVNICNALTDNVLGVLCNRPKSGEAAEVAVVGIVTVIAAEALVGGDPVYTSTSGTAQKTTTGGVKLGKVLRGAATGELATVLINCVNA